MRISIGVMILALALIAFGPGAVQTDARASGRGGGRGGAGSATLTVSPNPVPAWGTFYATGCGYTVGLLTTVAVEKPGGLGFFNTIVDANGCVAFSKNVDGPGTYGLKVYQLNHNKNTLMGSTTFAVQ